MTISSCLGKRLRYLKQIFDPQKKCVADSDFFKSKSQNTPFSGWELTGQASFTIVNGNIVYES